MPVINERGEMSMDKNRNIITVKTQKIRLILMLLTGVLVLLFLASCVGVAPPVDEIDTYDTLDQPFPHQEQEKKTGCLNAAGSATLDYHGFDYSQEFLNTIIDGSGVNLVNFVNNEVPGYNAKYVYIPLGKIKELLNIYDIPIIVAQKTNPSADPKKVGHARVVIGYGEDYVKVSNPSDGKEHILDEDYFLLLNIFWDNTDPNRTLSIVIYPNDLNLDLPPSAFKGGLKKDDFSEYSEPIIGIN